MTAPGPGVTAPDQLAVIYPWLPAGAVAAYADAYNDGAVDPWAVVRQDTRYDDWFPGNRMPDGQVRYTEFQYAGAIEGYEIALESVGLNANNPYFRELFPQLIEGDVSPDELYQERLRPVYDRIISASDAIRQEYASVYGLDLTEQEILASALSPDIQQAVFERRLTQAEVAGEAVESGFQLDEQLLEDVLGAGVTREAADMLFSTAAGVIPTLQVLAQRHADPDDEFDINDFLSAELFADPNERRRMRRLVAQEQAAFTGGLGVDVAVGRSGGLAGLQER